MRGLFERLFGARSRPQNPHKTRPRPQSVDDLEKLERIRYLRWLRRYDPDAYDAAMRGAVGLPRSRSGDPLQAFVSTLETLRKAGLDQIIRPPEDNLLKEVIRAFGSGAALALLQSQGLRPAVLPASTPNALGTPPPAVPPPDGASSAPPADPPREAPGPLGGLSLTSRLLIAQLEKRTPEEAADWLRSQTHPIARQVVQVLAQTPDDHLPALLGRLAQDAPDLAGAIAWLRSRPEWFLQAVHCLRARQADAESAL